VATGQPTDPNEVKSVGAAVSVPTLVGSGIAIENIHDYGNANALIVGSSIKQDGLWMNPIDMERARALVRAFETR
jgi:predicted TIM-barrel enzyme